MSEGPPLITRRRGLYRRERRVTCYRLLGVVPILSTYRSVLELRHMRKGAPYVATVVLLALAAPGWAQKSPGSESTTATIATFRADAHRLGEDVRHHSLDLSHRIASGARAAGHELGSDARRFAQYVRRWWTGLRSHTA